MCDSYSGPLLARGSHLAGAFANGSFGFAGIGDVGDGGVHGTLPVSCAIHDEGNQVLEPQAIPFASRISRAAPLMAIA